VELARLVTGLLRLLTKGNRVLIPTLRVETCDVAALIVWIQSTRKCSSLRPNCTVSRLRLWSSVTRLALKVLGGASFTDVAPACPS
jgi:hypothetical protein